jgi:hypothetical protein
MVPFFPSGKHLIRFDFFAKGHVSVICTSLTREHIFHVSWSSMLVKPIKIGENGESVIFVYPLHAFEE